MLQSCNRYRKYLDCLGRRRNDQFTGTCKYKTIHFFVYTFSSKNNSGVSRSSNKVNKKISLTHAFVIAQIQSTSLTSEKIIHHDQNLS